MTRKMLSDFPGRLSSAKNRVEQHLRFSIGLSPGFLGWKKHRICKSVLNPLLPFLELAVVYELQTDTSQFQKIESYVKQRNHRYELDLAGRKWQNFLPILYKPRMFSTIHEIRGSILLACKNGDIPWEKIFRQASGPCIIDNASVGSGKAALQYAKRNESSNHVFVIIDKINSGLESLTILSEINTVLRLFHLAARTCTWPRVYQFDIESIQDKAE